MTIPHPMGRNWRRAAAVAAAMLAAAVVPARADTLRLTLTVDNWYALYEGTDDGALRLLGSDRAWEQADRYTLDLDPSRFLYVVTSSDGADAQGFLAQVENLSTGSRFYSGDPVWQVAATGLGPDAPFSGSPADLALLSEQIGLANAGGTASHGWASLTAGPANGAWPWRWVDGIDGAARWAWYSSDGDPDPTTPGADHDEWLIIRVPVAAAPVPQPPTFLLALAGTAVIGLRLRPRWRRSAGRGAA